jgi:hypothetical protein
MEKQSHRGGFKMNNDKSIRCEDIVRHGLQLFPNLTREEFFDLRFISVEDFDKFVGKLKSELNCSLPSNFNCDETALKIVDTLASEIKRAKEMRE